MSLPSDRRPLPRSLYAATARPAPRETLLAGETRARVAVVGGGFTGLSEALHLAEVGVDTAVLEANEVGWGASGRNGGQVNPGLKWDPDALEAAFGADLGGRMVRLGHGAPDLVFDLIARHDIACEPIRGGTLRAAVSRRSEAGVRQYAAEWAARGAPVELLDRTSVARLAGTDAYPSAAYDRRGGNVNPLGYARGLAEAALKAGARIFSGAKVLRLVRDGGGWTVETAGGTVRADRVILATNGYSDDLWPGLRRTVVPVFSAIAATAPLAPDLAARIMPARPVLYEMSAAYAYYRMDAGGRFLVGGRSAQRETDVLADYRGLIGHALRIFPDLAGAEWTHCWNGRVAITRDYLPHVHEPAEGIHIGLGYNGRGVAMATAVGRMLARRAAGGSAEELDLPVTKVASIWGHAAWPLAVTAEGLWERLRERLGV
jgi:glycine/D-amino acid oxidase-like deaminating enzyme